MCATVTQMRRWFPLTRPGVRRADLSPQERGEVCRSSPSVSEWGNLGGVATPTSPRSCGERSEHPAGGEVFRVRGLQSCTPEASMYALLLALAPAPADAPFVAVGVTDDRPAGK